MTAKLLRAAFFITCFFYAGSAFASGGACPSGLPVTGNNCYFIAANGADTNSGTSESSPWAHAPGMPNCKSNCAATTPGPGNGFIFRGGDTWHFGNSSATPYTGGAFDGYQANGWSGTASSPIYIGVDKKWYSGSSWVRPIFAGDNPTSPGINSYVASCPYQTAGDGNSMADFSGGNTGYIIFDNFEMTGMCQTTSTDQAYVGENQPKGGLQFWNLYVHGWSHLQFYSLTSPTVCGSPGLCFAMWGFRGGVGGAPLPVYKNIVIDGSDSDARSLGACYCNLYDMEGSVIRYTSQTITTSPHIFANNLVEYFWDNGHGNLYESVGDFTGTNAFYGNVVRHVNTTSGANPVGVWMLPDTSSTDYFFNNVFYDWNGAQYLNIGNNGTSVGNYVIFNNTFQSNVAQSIMNCQYMQGGTLRDANNLFIDDGTQYSSPCNTKASTSPLLMSNQTATADGLLSSLAYAFLPPSGAPSIAGAGTNESSFCTSLAAAGLTGAATACQSDTTYACVYDTNSHTVSCPARNPAPRPSGNWDIGAYQAGSTQSSGPAPPTGLLASVQ